MSSNKLDLSSISLTRSSISMFEEMPVSKPTCAFFIPGVTGRAMCMERRPMSERYRGLGIDDMHYRHPHQSPSHSSRHGSLSNNLKDHTGVPISRVLHGIRTDLAHVDMERRKLHRLSIGLEDDIQSILRRHPEEKIPSSH